MIAAIGLLGAALAPALQALDAELTWESAAFATIVLVASGWVSIPRDWRELLITTSVVVGVQVEWLAAEAVSPPIPGTVAVAAGFVLTLLGIAAARQIFVKNTEIDPLALSYALVSFGLTMTLATQIFDDRVERGIALLATAAVWALVVAALSARKLPDLGLVVGVSALGFLTVGMADLLAGATLTVAWAVEAIVLTALARQLRDARLRLMAIAYIVLAAGHALTTEAPPGLLFDEQGDQLVAVLPLAATAVATAAAGLLAPIDYAPRTESGLLSFVRELRVALSVHTRGIAETLCFAAAALGTMSASFALVSISFEWGHVAASLVAASIGAISLAVSGRLESRRLVVASFAWLAIVLTEAFGFDVDSFYDDGTALSLGGWSVIAASAGLTAGSYALLFTAPAWRIRNLTSSIAVGIAAVSLAVAVPFVTESEQIVGLGYLGGVIVCGALAAGVFSRAGFRNTATALWSYSLLLLVGAEALIVTDSIWRAVVIAATALVVGTVSHPLHESRLWLAGGSLAVATTAVVLLVQVQPWLGDSELARRLAIASAASALATFGLAALRWSEERWRDLVTVLWVVGLVALLATERVLVGDLRTTAVAAALTGGVFALAAHPLGEVRLWMAGAIVSGVATVATLVMLTPPSHVLVASDAPADGLWVLVGCLVGVTAIALTAPDEQTRVVLEVVVGGIALYGLSLGILEVAERLSTASVETDFERGHTAVSGVWAFVGFALLVVGLLRGSTAIRYGGLALFGLSLAKIFLYDLSSLSSVARAFSFILVGGLLLAGGFFLQRLSDRLGPPKHS